ncbi:MAG: hypothetical protein NTV30_09010, partial [Chloroflexi bacterium]|nr:hypothetical protein [Chloroflexota bacterium]
MQKTIGLPANDSKLQWMKNKLKGLFGWWPTYRKSRLGVLGLVVFLLMIILALLAPVIATHNPRQMTLDLWQLPSIKHYLGTSSVGQDIFSQLLYAGRVSLFVGVITALITNVVGTLIGLIAGYFGGWIDEIIMRITDI